jgi:hypothetical protein
MKRDSVRLGDLFSRHEALACGMSRYEIEWALKSGRWLRLRRGIYCLRETYDAADATGRHLLLSRAALRAHDDRHVLSHLSAALTHGLPAPLGDLGRPALTIDGRPASTDRQEDLIVQVAALRPHETSPWQEGRRTSAARTIADCLRHLTPLESVPLADAAVREGRTTVGEIAETLHWQQGWPYLVRGLAALRLVDGRRETWLESYSFVALYEEGIALPVPQVQIYDEWGAFVARADGLWVDQATVAEADGRAKYALAELEEVARVDSADLADARFEGHRRALIREKVREDAVRGTGLEVVRWGTHDVVHELAKLARTVRAAWRRGDPRRFTGSIVMPPPVGLLAVDSG